MFKPFNDNVVIELQGADESNNVLIPESVREKPSAGIIVAVGPGRYEYGTHILMTATKGQLVVWARGQETEVKFGNKKYYVVSERNLLISMED